MGYSSMTKEELQEELKAWSKDLNSINDLISWSEKNNCTSGSDYKERDQIQSEIDIIKGFL